MKNHTKAELRQRMRQARRSLSSEDRLAASWMTCGIVARSAVFMAAARLAIYHPVRGELDVTPLQYLAWRLGKKVYLPVIVKGRGPTMRFAQIQPATALVFNRFGIPEPTAASVRLIDPRNLDLVLTPLLAFDKYGHRIGMGAGYYDRCFRFLRHAGAWRKPKLLGVAYSFQEAANLDPEPWDVPLWGMATEQAMRPPLRIPTDP